MKRKDVIGEEYVTITVDIYSIVCSEHRLF